MSERAYTLRVCDLEDASDELITETICSLDHDRMQAWPLQFAISEGRLYLLIEHWRPDGNREQDTQAPVDAGTEGRQPGRARAGEADDARAAECVEPESLALPLGETQVGGG